jgi:hypothetical protein
MKKSQPNPRETITGSRPKMGVFKTTKERTTVGGVTKPYNYTTESIDTSGYSKGKKSYQIKKVSGESDKMGLNKVKSVSYEKINRSQVPSTIKKMSKK